jgi:hypothetical protein
MAYAIASLLEHPTKLEEAFSNTHQNENKNPNAFKQNNAFNSDKYNNQPQASISQIEEVHGCLFDNFYIAYDALDLKNSNTQGT